MKFPFDLPFLPEGCSIALLESCGMKPGQCAEAWALAHPQLLREQSGQFLQAGASAPPAPPPRSHPPAPAQRARAFSTHPPGEEGDGQR